MTQIDTKTMKEVLMPCKRGTDVLTKGQSCKSKSAYITSNPGSKAPSFKCKTCGFEWVVPTGGQFHGA
jgi:transposase-like protein